MQTLAHVLTEGARLKYERVENVGRRTIYHICVHNVSPSEVEARNLNAHLEAARSEGPVDFQVAYYTCDFVEARVRKRIARQFKHMPRGCASVGASFLFDSKRPNTVENLSVL